MTEHNWIDHPQRGAGNYRGFIQTHCGMTSKYYLCVECGLIKRVKWMGECSYEFPGTGHYVLLNSAPDCNEVIIKQVLE
jgi:hypothetical protein